MEENTELGLYEFDGQLSLFDDRENYVPNIDQQFRKSNALIRRTSATSLFAEKLLLLAMAKIEVRDSRNYVGTAEGLYYQDLYQKTGSNFAEGYIASFSSSELKELLRNKSNTYYKQLDQLLNHTVLSDQWSVIYDQDGVAVRTNMVISGAYINGRILLKFHPDLGPLLTSLRSGFTVLDAGLLLSLRDMFSFLLYQNLKSQLGLIADRYKKQGIVLPEYEIRYNLAELKFLTGVLNYKIAGDQATTDKIRDALLNHNHELAAKIAEDAELQKGNKSKVDFREFRRQGLKRAFNEINGFAEIDGLDREKPEALEAYRNSCQVRSTTDIHFRYKMLRSGGRVTDIVFYVSWADIQRHNKIESKPKTIDPDMLLKAGKIFDEDIPATTITQMLHLANNDLDRIKSVYAYAKAQKPDNLIGFMISALRDDYDIPESTPRNKFHNFAERNTTAEELAELEKRLLGQ